MKEIGKMLKKKREQKNISLSDVHKAIKVQEKHLLAIEEGNVDMNTFFAEIYYKSFLRSYARYLGLDSEEIVGIFNARKHELTKESFNQNGCSCVCNKSIENTSEKNRNINIKKILIIFMILMMVVFLIFFLYLKYVTVSSSLLEVEGKQQKDNSNGQSYVKGMVAIVKPEKIDIKEKLTITEKKEMNADIEQKLVIEATNNVWIRLDCNNKTVYEGTLLSGNKKTWDTVNKSFKLKIGYVPGIKVFFNGNLVNVLVGAVQNVNTIVLKN